MHVGIEGLKSCTCLGVCVAERRMVVWPVAQENVNYIIRPVLRLFISFTESIIEYGLPVIRIVAQR